MDGSSIGAAFSRPAPSLVPDGSGVTMDVNEGLALIKGRMPLTYADIQRQATGGLGREAFALVRRALRGERNCFYAVEAGHVVGAPFDDLDSETGQLVALGSQFGIGFLTLWPLAEGVAHGAD